MVTLSKTGGPVNARGNFMLFYGNRAGAAEDPAGEISLAQEDA